MIETKNKTMEEVADEIFEALVIQGKQCKSSSSCLYVDDDDNHCAVGFLLADSESLRGYEGDVVQMIADLDESELGPNVDFIKDNMGVMEKLQGLHDSNLKVERGRIADDLVQANHVYSAWIMQWARMGDDL